MIPVSDPLPPSDSTTKARYQGEAGRHYHSAKRSIPERATPWLARHRAVKFARFVRPGDTLLEYGVGFGWNLGGLRCARRIGYDVSEYLGEFVRQCGIEFTTDLGSVSKGSIDCIVCHHTLEHALEPANVLREIHGLLRPGGLLLLCVPYEKEMRFRSFQRGERNRHLYSWNPQTLAALTEELGFRVEEAGLGDFGQEVFAARLADRLGLGEPAFKALRFLANRLKQEMEVRVVARKSPA